MRIAVMGGTGSLGIVVGGLLAKNGYDVELIGSNREGVIALNNKGAVIKGSIEAIVPVKAITPEQMKGIYDYVFLVVKQDSNHVALPQLLPYLNQNSVVCTLQNGMPEESVSAYIGPERTVGGIVIFASTRLEPEISFITTSPEVINNYAIEIGEISGQLTPRIFTIQKILSAIGGCSVSENLVNTRWSKLVVNATFGGMTAALGCACKNILKNYDAMDIVAHIADETIKTAHACGYSLGPYRGENLECLELQQNDKVADKFEFYQRFFGPYSNTKLSILQDLEKRKKTEIKYINGYVCEMGKKKNISTPYNDFVVNLINKAEEEGQVPQFETNLKLFQNRFKHIKE